MADLDLRPLSLGEILDRTFSIYRRNFLLFVGITGLPNLLLLAFRLFQVFVPTAGMAAGFLPLFFVGAVLFMLVYLFAQGGTVYAVSELYLGRPTTIGASLRRMRSQLGSLFGVTVLNFLAIFGASILLIIPGIYVACRLITCVPAALLEDLGPVSSLERSFSLTKDNAGRAFVIYLLYFIMVYAAVFLLMFPFTVMMGISAQDPSAVRMWTALAQIGNILAIILVSPFLTIATAVFYYDLRVRKE